MTETASTSPHDGQGTSAASRDESMLVVDGHSLAFRAFFALPVENFSTSHGQPTNAVWGFATMLAQVIATERPTRLAVAFDMPGGTFRNAMLPQYKGTRQAAPEDLLTQLPLIQRLLTALGVRHIEAPGYEGDDIIATLAVMGEQAGYRSLVLSGDRDAFQLIDERITVLYPGHHFKDLKRMTPQAVEDKYRVSPAQYPDLAALRGETADNIPGVPGVGDGYAAKWIARYGSLNGILEHAQSITGKKGEALREHADQVRLNRKVNALVRNLDLGVGVDDLDFGAIDMEQLENLFTELEFGEPTRRRIVQAFGAPDPVAQDSDAEPVGHDDHARAGEPDFTPLGTAKDLRTWVDDHLSHVTSDAPAASDGDPEGGPGGVPTVYRHAHCAEQVKHAWILHAEGSAKPDRASCTRIALLAPDDQGAFIDADADLGTGHDGGPDGDGLRRALADLIRTRACTMVVHGCKEHGHMLAAVGVPMARPLFDSKLAGYLVEPDFHPRDLEEQADHFLGVSGTGRRPPKQGSFDLEGEGHRLGGQQPPSVHSDAVCAHVVLVRDLALRLAGDLDSREQFGLLRAIELPVSEVLDQMEADGAAVDAARLNTMRERFAADARQAQEIAWDKAGRTVNLQSPKQLQQVLFEDMGLRHSRRTKSGSYTTNATALQEMYLRSTDNERANGFLGALLRYRETNKLKQIVQTLIDAVNPDDGRIHTTYEQTVAATGRLSSVDPNLQNIPNRNADGREIRSAFVPGAGYDALLSADYSQVELRIMADLSSDEALIEAFRSGTDFHRYVASLVYDIPMEQISADQRSHVKAMSYGLAYGLSTFGLAQQLRISPAAADVLRDKYFSTFGKVHDYLESLVAGAREHGYTETMFGRRRYFPGLKSTRRQVRDAAERAALNAPIQGSAADIMKLAMIRASHDLTEAGVRSRIILQIHDELVVEIAPGEREQVTGIVKDAMEHAVDLAVPLDVSTGIGADWQLAAH